MTEHDFPAHETLTAYYEGVIAPRAERSTEAEALHRASGRKHTPQESALLLQRAAGTSAALKSVADLIDQGKTPDAAVLHSTADLYMDAALQEAFARV